MIKKTEIEIVFHPRHLFRSLTFQFPIPSQPYRVRILFLGSLAFVVLVCIYTGPVMLGVLSRYIAQPQRTLVESVGLVLLLLLARLVQTLAERRWFFGVQVRRGIIFWKDLFFFFFFVFFCFFLETCLWKKPKYKLPTNLSQRSKRVCFFLFFFIFGSRMSQNVYMYITYICTHTHMQLHVL